MATIPPSVLKKLYVEGSLKAEASCFTFDLKNLVAPATIVGFHTLHVNGQPIDPEQVTVVPPNGNVVPMKEIKDQRPLHFPVGVTITLRVEDETLPPGDHELTLHTEVKEIGSLDIPISDTVE
jgi:hypothetical protein